MFVATCVLHSVVLSVGCIHADEQTAQIESYATVSSYLTSTCSTASVIGLSKQIADEISCANPTGLVAFAPGGNLTITSNAVLPYLAEDARTDLMEVAQNDAVQLNSAFRTVAQQYLLYEWNQAGRCNIAAAASPGTSNHESGRALDVANYTALITMMEDHGWAHDVAGDEVHFDHLASSDIRGQDVRAFQKLWNRNHPADAIAEDGAYGPATEARLQQSPAEGFAIGSACGGTRDLEVVAVKGPDRVAPQQRAHYAITLKNAGTVSWSSTTKLRLASGTSSSLYDASWESPAVITTLGAPIAAGAMGTVDFDVTTPATATELPVMQGLVLDDAGTRSATIQLALTVVPGMKGDESGEGNEMSDGDVAGGCHAGGRGGLFVLLALIGLVRSRRTV